MCVYNRLKNVNIRLCGVDGWLAAVHQCVAERGQHSSPLCAHLSCCISSAVAGCIQMLSAQQCQLL